MHTTPMAAEVILIQSRGGSPYQSSDGFFWEDNFWSEFLRHQILSPAARSAHSPKSTSSGLLPWRDNSSILFSSAGHGISGNVDFQHLLQSLHFMKCDLPPLRISLSSLQNLAYLDEDRRNRKLHPVPSSELALTLDAEGSSKLQRWVRGLLDLFPGYSPSNNNDARGRVISSDEAFNSRLTRALLFSFANNMTGIGDIDPVHTVSLLASQSHLIQLLVNALRTTSKHAQRSLVEKLAGYAVDAGEHEVLALLLRERVIDVNKVPYFGYREECTLIEWAAYKKDAPMVKLLLNANADVNHTYTDGHRGVLNRFLAKYTCVEDSHGGVLNESSPGNYKSINLEPWIELVPSLLDKGAEFSLDALSETEINLDSSPELFLCFMESCWPSEHEIFFDETTLDPLGKLAGLPNGKGVPLLEKVLHICKSVHEGECLVNEGSAKQIREACARAILWDNSGIVDLLLPHCGSWPGTLCAAIRRGNNGLIRRLMQANLNSESIKWDVRIPPPLISDCEQDSLFPFLNARVTSPLAGALAVNNLPLVQELESAGALEHMQQEPMLFEVALLAAASAGNANYTAKLLAIPVEIDASNAAWVLKIAISRGWEDIVEQILDPGLGFEPSHEIYDNFSFMEAALEQKNSRIIYALLDADSINPEASRSLIISAVEWGNKSVIADILSVVSKD
ncbi:hypothetical protein F5Y15DRAFT_94624 [Xylariaceae sp. FL0016]|nr:hypothetical protein F5Y15DRAFT_94624 [Xylariaceae sp. FL0016]